MIVVRYEGGLGNQMFQHALLLALQKNYPDVEVVADLSYARYQHQGFELSEVFGIELKEWQPVDRESYLEGTPVSATDYLAELFALDTSNHYYLQGDWQNERYLARVKEEIFSAFVFRAETVARNRELMKEIAATNSISIHLREGDYLKAGFPLCGKEYYQKAMAYIEARVEHPRYYVFSDNIAYAKGVIEEKENVRFIDHNQGKASFRDMQLMSLCQHNIIANSSFSFWAAYLNKNSEKQVVVPNKPVGSCRTAVTCAGWVVLD
jgi:hypothetical protein